MVKERENLYAKAERMRHGLEQQESDIIRDLLVVCRELETEVESAQRDYGCGELLAEIAALRADKERLDYYELHPDCVRPRVDERGGPLEWFAYKADGSPIKGWTFVVFRAAIDAARQP